ncbi:hypothetical protein DY000_02033278 [Brassica cretica]|uniref:EXS domain-containing protein n=1 Tax=Brassica cretica TaxID=69181 RepID=A0ABQ7DVC0_BRACR|nr:hypothetical protein DY000_02033278 [Brassica cretica]
MIDEEEDYERNIDNEVGVKPSMSFITMLEEPIHNFVNTEKCEGTRQCWFYIPNSEIILDIVEYSNQLEKIDSSGAKVDGSDGLIQMDGWDDALCLSLVIRIHAIRRKEGNKLETGITRMVPNHAPLDYLNQNHETLVMFENPVTSSPHLRKSGSKSLFLDPGVSGHLGGASEMGGDLKGSSSPLQITTMVPSPIFLWRFKVVLFLFWALCCCKIGWDSVMRMSIDLRDLFLYEAFLYYNPLLLVTMMVWLWGVNLWVFSQGSVNYAKVFDLDHNHLTHREMWKVLLYIAFALVLIFPFDIFYLSSRYFLLRTLWRIAFPLQPITFPDFFLADILTSMVKVFSDLERSVCRMVHRQVYFWVIGSNLVLRCAWTYKLSAHLRHNYITVFAVTAMEMFRRFQWVFFRVENEWNKITKSHPLAEISLEEDKLLGSATTHDV